MRLCSANARKALTTTMAIVARRLTVAQVKAQILSLVNDVAGGEQIEITKHGRTVARLVPAAGPESLRGRLTVVASSTPDDEHLFSTGATWESA